MPCNKDIKVFQVFFFTKLVDASKAKPKFGLDEFSGVFLK